MVPMRFRSAQPGLRLGPLRNGLSHANTDSDTDSDTANPDASAAHTTHADTDTVPNAASADHTQGGTRCVNFRPGS
jgi:hypothetical protein